MSKVELKPLFARDPTVKEAAEMLGVTRAHVYVLLGRGELSGYKLGRATRLHQERINVLRETLAAFAPPRDAT